MRLNCPHCGLRDASEFSYGGDATREYPGLENKDPQTWHDYTYLRANPRGAHTEYWQHLHGCRIWLQVTRDTLSHEISATRAVGVWATSKAGD